MSDPGICNRSHGNPKSVGLTERKNWIIIVPQIFSLGHMNVCKNVFVEILLLYFLSFS